MSTVRCITVAGLRVFELVKLDQYVGHLVTALPQPT